MDRIALGRRYALRSLAGIAFSLICAGVFYFAWMAAFLAAAELNNSVVETILWLLAPVITAAGFATGVAIFERLAKTDGAKFLRIYIWPLIGCTIGAGFVFWFGPMLIVFGMFVVGTVSVALRELAEFAGGECA